MQGRGQGLKSRLVVLKEVGVDGSDDGAVLLRMPREGVVILNLVPRDVQRGWRAMPVH